MRRLIGRPIGIGVRRNAGRGRSVGDNIVLPGFFEHVGRHTGAVVVRHDTPERGAVRFVDVAETLLIDVRGADDTAAHATVQAERWADSRVGMAAAGRRRLREDSNWVVEDATRAVRCRSV